MSVFNEAYVLKIAEKLLNRDVAGATRDFNLTREEGENLYQELWVCLLAEQGRFQTVEIDPTAFITNTLQRRTKYLIGKIVKQRGEESFPEHVDEIRQAERWSQKNLEMDLEKVMDRLGSAGTIWSFLLWLSDNKEVMRSTGIPRARYREIMDRVAADWYYNGMSAYAPKGFRPKKPKGTGSITTKEMRALFKAFHSALAELARAEAMDYAKIQAKQSQ
ncbi:MAG: hypothetical protein QNK37_38485 [Acidobacteriota bacterium]|nr:hypothetical protein [Acidobacteriota bacterium]